MRVIGAAEIDRALTPLVLVDRLREAFSGAYVAPPRHHHTIPRPEADAALLLMPAWTKPDTKPAFLGTKVVTVYPDNASRSLPSVIGSYLLMDGASGALLAVMDGTRLTLHRTAAASALAAGYLAREDAKRLLMVGAGALAPFMIKAHLAMRPALSDVVVWARRAEAAKSLIAEIGRDPALDGRRLHVATDLETAVRAADLVTCATMTTEPLVRGAWLKTGAHLDMVGAYSLAMREADDEALRISRVFIDTPAALVEGGDVAVAVKAGTFDADRIAGDLAALVGGTVPGRRDGTEITLFKSIGASIEDLAAAAAVWRAVG